MLVEILVEQERKCGFRRPGLYLRGSPLREPCERLPFPFYGGFPGFCRGFEIVTPFWLFSPTLFPECASDMPGHDHDRCPVCTPPNEQHYLMWVGRQYYTPESFLKEASEVGISKRIANLPTDFQFGHSWVFLAHIEAANGDPGCFAAFMPSHVDLVVEDENDLPELAYSLKEQLGDHLHVVKVIPDAGNS